jgi:hypothetical protein
MKEKIDLNIVDKVTNNGRVKLSYDVNDYNFNKIISTIFNCADIENIHLQESCNFDILNFDTDQSTKFHKKFYDTIHETEFLNEYKIFLEKNIKILFDEPIIYQKIPTFRIQVPNNLGVAEFHKDKNYSHSSKELNIFLPITNAFGNNTIWAESIEDKNDFTPLEANYGEYFIWNGANLNHGNKINDTEKTRISIDFRIMPLSDYDETAAKDTVTTKMKLKIGDYFDII